MYTFDKEVIHDGNAMWHLGLTFKVEYESLKKRLLEIEDDGYVMHNGDILFKYDNPAKFKRIVREYKKQLEFIEGVFKKDFEYVREESYVKYLSEDK